MRFGEKKCSTSPHLHDGGGLDASNEVAIERYCAGMVIEISMPFKVYDEDGLNILASCAFN